jgi:hypothetical protein
MHCRFGWATAIGNMLQVIVRGLGERRPDVWAHYSLTIAACNLTHMRTLGEGRPKAIL